MEDTNDIRNQLLSELIDKMHSRLADKEYPSEPVEETVTAVMEPEAEEKPVGVDSEDISEEDLAALEGGTGE